jgi:hypothetical protein
MFVILWEFEVKPVNLVGFEKAYGPAGAWVQLFQRDSHFRGTQLLHDPSRDFWYFTADFWDSKADYENFLAANRSAYERLDSLLEGLTLRERLVVSFNLSPGKVPGS